MPERHPLVFVLHSSNLYGTERMSLATAEGLSNEFEPIFLAPPGPALTEAERLGFATGTYRTSLDLAKALRPILKAKKSLTLVATGPRYSLVCMAINLLYQRKIKQVQIVHAGAGEWKDYGRKKYLNPFKIVFVTVSHYCRDKLIHYGVKRPIEVVGNYLREEQVQSVPRHRAFNAPPAKALIVSRLVELKRLDVIFDALDCEPKLADFPIDIIGDGPDRGKYDRRAAKYPNVRILGFQANVAEYYAACDLLIHTCPTEAFGMVVLEAMAAYVPVLVTDQGGAATLVDDGRTGFKFKADDPQDLARKLVELRSIDPMQLNGIVETAAGELHTRFSEKASLRKYRRLFAPDP
jgi:glycosyltransferase involved in cell wall biosynthesis